MMPDALKRQVLLPIFRRGALKFGGGDVGDRPSTSVVVQYHVQFIVVLSNIFLYSKHLSGCCLDESHRHHRGNGVCVCHR